YPPFKTCQNATCSRRQNGLLLGKSVQHKVVYFSLRHGAVPAWSVQFYCESCKTTYHMNYKVVGDRHIYYDYTASLLDVLQITEHYFVDYQVVKLWKAMMHTSCTSATSCAHIYNLALANAESTKFPDTKWFTKEVTMDHVWNAFVICSLLEDCCQRQCVLEVNQRLNQSEHFVEAMLDRNRRMRSYNQPLARRHFCSKCTQVISGEENISKLVSVIVVDGVVVSRPCCSILNCWVHLRSPHDRFCHVHSAHLNHCTIKGCTRPVLSGRLTCDILAHQESEALHTLRGKSRFRLHERLERSCAIHGCLANVQIGAEEDEGDEADATQAIGEEVYDVEKKLGKKKRLHAQFTRNYTHCEELIVAPCGIIHARKTMHNAEGVGSVAEFIRCVFRDPETRPTHVFFDNNCRLALHVKDDPFFQDIGLSVDVFHFECKYSKMDTFCQENCNPAAFPELKTDYGEWYFNSSACEQTNSWFGNFNPITRGMKPAKFDFFLDEMILC
ncbi:hypothetical protein C8R48DRAFT_608530, partial [Suillus tomentosus]